MPTRRQTPAALGFSMPAEWEPHEATWLGWPHNPTDWPGQAGHDPLGLRRDRAQDRAGRNGAHAGRLRKAEEKLARQLSDPRRRRRWSASSSSCIRPTAAGRATAGRCSCGDGRRRTETAIVHFHFNAWAKYPDWQKDRRVPETAAQLLGKRLFHARVRAAGLRPRRRRHRGQRPRHAADDRGVLSRPEDAGAQPGPGPQGIRSGAAGIPGRDEHLLARRRRRRATTRTGTSTTSAGS